MENEEKAPREVLRGVLETLTEVCEKLTGEEDAQLREAVECAFETLDNAM
jgi:predicted site-specific integrase-resolvase